MREAACKSFNPSYKLLKSDRNVFLGNIYFMYPCMRTADILSIHLSPMSILICQLSGREGEELDTVNYTAPQKNFINKFSHIGVQKNLSFHQILGCKNQQSQKFFTIKLYLQKE